jgi:hypothetical protein
MKVVVLQSNYVPWKGYFDLINDADVFVFYDEVQYTTFDWRNRNKICSNNALHWLTISIPKEAQRLKISEVELKAENWQAEHVKALTNCYRKAPHFAQLEALMQEFWIDKQWTHLSELNHALIKKISGELGITTRFDDSKNYTLHPGRVERMLNLLIQVGATEYITGPSGREYLGPQEELFRENNISITYKSYGDYPRYKQLREPFEHGVSILDMIANLPWAEIPHYIWGWRQE